MNNFSFRVLKIGLAITFIWIGVLILKDPEAWGGGFIEPWALKFLLVPLKTAMLATGIFDISVGLLFLISRFAWLAGLLGAIHLIIVLAVSGINAITVRDLGLLAGAIAVFLNRSKIKI